MAVKIGLVGAGGIANAHASGYLKVPDEARITAVCDVIQESAAKLAERVGNAQVFTSIDDMLTNGDVEAIDVCLPHHLHKDAIVAGARAGKHVICEKPLCLTLDQAEEISHAVSENGVKMMCAHNQLFYPAVQKARQLLDEGVLGKLYEIRTVDVFFNRGLNRDMGWRGSRELMGGGELIDTGYHPSYLLLYLAGSEPTEVAAMLSQHHLKMDGEDSAQVLVRFADGSVGNIVSSWAYERPEGWSQFNVIGEKGQMFRAGEDLHLHLRDAEPQVFSFEPVRTFELEMADFVRRIAEDRTPMQTNVDGTRVLKLILGAYKSVSEKRIVTLTDEA